jgi:hypothetical protein
MKQFATVLLVVLCSRPLLAWHEPGHQIIALLAYDLLTAEQQSQLRNTLKEHPRWSDDFTNSEIRSDEERERWLVGRAGYWPDVARSQMEYNRPTWHYQLGATLTIGDVPGVPANPGVAPAAATLETQELHIAQAVEVCRRVIRDSATSKADRAIAVCWLIHLAGDAHQPCHAGSLYVEKVFPDGDRGANLISTMQGRNLHALWDGLLGSQYDAGDVRRRCSVIRSDVTNWEAARQASLKPAGLDPLTWLAESAEFGRSHVYTAEILEPVQATRRGLTPKVASVDLSEGYLREAGELARVRAAFAAHRLARILHHDLR